MPNNCGCECKCQFSGVKLEPYHFPEGARLVPMLLLANQQIPKGTIMGELTSAPGTYAKYDPVATDGRQLPKLIAAYDMETDANGCFVSCCGSPASLFNGNAPGYYRGVFKTTDLSATSSEIQSALAAGLGRLVMGNASNGLIDVC